MPCKQILRQYPLSNCDQLTGPTLQVAGLRVEGPRYWAHTHSPGRLCQASAGGPRDAAQGAAALFVARRTGAISYEGDPRGVRSLLSRAAHLVSPAYPPPTLTGRMMLPRARLHNL